MQSFLSICVSTIMLISLAIVPWPVAAQGAPVTATPIQHIVVIFGENISFDHYFGTYPKAANPPGQPPFMRSPALQR